MILKGRLQSRLFFMLKKTGKAHLHPAGLVSA
jgi:hypothetical protein